MDSIEPLPLSSGSDSILVIVCRLTKMALFIPTVATLPTRGLAWVFMEHVFSTNVRQDAAALAGSVMPVQAPLLESGANHHMWLPAAILETQVHTCLDCGRGEFGSATTAGTGSIALQFDNGTIVTLTDVPYVPGKQPMLFHSTGSTGSMPIKAK